MKSIFFVFMFLLVNVFTLQAQQSSVKLLAELPLQFGVGYEGRLSHRFSLSVQAGALTQPNSTIIVNLLQAFGTDEQIALMIKDAFKFGIVGELGVNYNFKRNYVGSFVQIISLNAGDSPTSLIESYFNEDISTYPTKHGRTQTKEATLNLKSTLYQAGLLYGRRFPLTNKHVEIDVEFGVSANVGSVSRLSSEKRNLDALSDELNNELRYDYSHYAFIPSLTAALVYKFDSR